MPASKDELSQLELKQRQTAAIKHGAEGTLKRIQQNKPLAMDDLQRRQEIIHELGFDPVDIPAGPMGKLISLVADNVLLAERFQDARLWAAETGDVAKWANLAQRSGWRNDKAINQLLELVKLQGEASNFVIDAIESAISENTSQ